MKSENMALWKMGKQWLDESDMILLGIGDQCSVKKAEKEGFGKEKILSFYNRLEEIVRKKPWFAVTLNTDDLIYESKLNRFFIVAPCGSEASGNVITNEHYDESEYLPQWQFYRNFLASTIGKKLCILELGMGMMYPSVARIPFERTVTWNRKAHLIRIHSKLAQVPQEMEDRSVCIAEHPLLFFENKM